jgi:hypothetical protein
MARIPVYEQQVSVNAPSAPLSARGRAVVGVGPGTQAIGEGLQRIAGALERREQVDAQIDRDAFELERDRISTEGRVWAASTSSRFDLDMADYAQRARTSASPGASGFVPDFMKNADELIKQTLETAPSQFARDQLTPLLVRSREQFGRQAIAFEAGERARFTGEQMQTGIEASTALVFADPGRFNDEMGKWGSTIQNANTLGPEGQAKVREFARAQLVNAAVTRWIDSNPAAARAVLSSMATDPQAAGAQVSVSGPNGQPMSVPVNMGTPKEMAGWIRYAEGKVGQVREEVGFRLKDAEAAYARGLPFANAPTRDELVASYGPVRGAREADNLDQMQQHSRRVQGFSTMSPQEIVAEIEKSRPGPTATAEDQARFDNLSRAAQQTMADRAQDPAQFALIHSPNVRQAHQRMSQNMTPETASQYAAATFAEQRRLGIENPRILSTAEAAQITQQLKSAEQPQQIAQTLQGYAQTWGARWPQVYAQVAGGLSPSTRVIANLPDTPAASTLANNINRKLPELRELIPGPDAKTIDQALDAELVPFRQSLIGITTGGVGTFNDYVDSAKRLAYIYTASGASPNDAAKRAVRELVDDAYTFSGATRIPKSVNSDAVDRGLRNILSDPGKFNVGVSATESRLFGENFTRDQINAALRQSGFWGTLGDDSGVALFMRGTNGVRAVEGPDGRPVTFTWQQIIDQSARPAAPRAQTRMVPETPGGAVTGRAITRPGAQ